jgi:hypothetical protein
MIFENVTDGELINELESRGYITNLLFNRHDIQSQIDSLNEDREDEGLEAVEMDDEEKDNILERINTEWYIERINESIFEKVSDYFDDDEEIEDED